MISLIRTKSKSEPQTTQPLLGDVVEGAQRRARDRVQRLLRPDQAVPERTRELTVQQQELRHPLRAIRRYFFRYISNAVADFSRAAQCRLSYGVPTYSSVGSTK